jgi:G3E family GTPase
VVESAGLCNRCAPYLRGSLAVAVMDVLSGVASVQKVGPMLRSADVVVLTRGDLVSQAERDVFRLRVAAVNRKARVIEINGLSGQGSRMLATILETSAEWAPEAELSLRFSMPAGVCSFCLGERRVGNEFASGNVRLMELPAAPDSTEPQP